MVALGQSESPEPTAFNKEEMDKYIGVSVAGYLALFTWPHISVLLEHQFPRHELACSR
jgi:hypothetical protein